MTTRRMLRAGGLILVAGLSTGILGAQCALSGTPFQTLFPSFFTPANGGVFTPTTPITPTVVPGTGTIGTGTGTIGTGTVGTGTTGIGTIGTGTVGTGTVGTGTVGMAT